MRVASCKPVIIIKEGKRWWDTVLVLSPSPWKRVGRFLIWRKGQQSGDKQMENAGLVLVTLCGPHSCPPLPVKGRRGFSARGFLPSVAPCHPLQTTAGSSEACLDLGVFHPLPLPSLGCVCVGGGGCCSVVFDSLRPHGGLSSVMNSPGKNTGVGGHSLLQGIFPTQGLNLDLTHCRQILYHRSHQGSPLSSLVAHHMSS